MESFVTVGVKNLTSIILPDISTTTFANILTTTHGPYAMQQIMGFNNQTVADKVPLEMLHLIDPHWLALIFLYSCTVRLCIDKETHRNV